MLVAAGAFLFGTKGMMDPIGPKEGMFAPVLFIVGAIALFSAALDVALIRRRGAAGAHRIARHLWRMGFAVFITAAISLIGQSPRFPEALQRMEYLAPPVALSLALTVFWLLRIRFGARWRQRLAAPAVRPARS